MIIEVVIIKNLTNALEVVPFIAISGLFIVLYNFTKGIFEKKFTIVNDEYFYITVIFAFLAMYLGSFLNFYERFFWWDTLLHFSSGVILGFFGISIIDYYFGKTVDEKADIYIIIIFGVFTAIGIGVFWEFYEFTFDRLLDGNMQRTVQVTDVSQLEVYISESGYFRDPGLADSMKDLFLAALGSGISSFISYPNLKKKYFKVFLKNKKIEKDQIKYIAIDLDGTLLNEYHEISEINVNALKKAQALNYKIILCSGRDTQAIRQYAKELDLYNNNNFIVSYNGAKGYFLKENGEEELLFETAFTTNEIRTINELVGNLGENFISYSGVKANAREPQKYIDQMSDNLSYEVGNEIVGDNILKAFIQDEPENIQEMYVDVETIIKEKLPHINIFTSTKNIIEITPSEAAKGIGIRKVFSLIDASPENLICFGDQNNDLSMFKYAKYSVAMANATTELKLISSHSTVSHKKSGVGLFIEKNLL